MGRERLPPPQTWLVSVLTPPPGPSEASGTSVFVFGVSAVEEELMRGRRPPDCLYTCSFT